MTAASKKILGEGQPRHACGDDPLGGGTMQASRTGPAPVLGGWSDAGGSDPEIRHSALPPYGTEADVYSPTMASARLFR